MKMHRGCFVGLACFFLLVFLSAKDESLAACSPPVKISGYSYNPTSIQDAYDYASNNLGLSSFTLLLAGQTFYEDLTLDGGAVMLDGGYDCSFTTKDSTSGILGTVTISTGSVNWAGGVGVKSTDRCDFDADLDGFTSIGSCAGSANDCNDRDPNIYPGALEICDGIDNNCNGQIDEGLTGTDVDGDGYSATGSCGGFTDDCNDNDASIHPGAAEIPYDGIDQDCSGADLTFAGESCSACHYLPNVSALHDLTTPPDATCATCHAPQVSNVVAGHFGKRVRTAGNNMTAGATITCTACHDQSAANHSGGIANGNGSDFVTNRLYAAWDTVPPSITCDTCHETRASLHATSTAHNNRIIDTSCAACHTSDTSVLGSPGTGTLTSAADFDTLHRSDCALCHAYAGTLLDAGAVRQVIQQGLDGNQISCLDCHTDKTTGHGNFTHPVEVGPNDLSYDAPGQLCSNCHTVATWAEIEGVTHNVATNGAGSCATCHNSTRQEVIDTIAMKANPTYCLDCHSDKQLTVHGTVDHLALGYVTGGTTYCLNCHDSGTAANATVTVTHSSNCTLCHTTVPNLQAGVPAGGGDCVTCHTNTWEVTHTTNPPDHSALVQVGTSSCASCHDNTLVSAAANTHNACSSCHDAQGNLISLAVGQTFAAGGDCTSCHTGTWTVTHTTTATPDHTALVTVGTTSCASCHSDPPPLADAADPKVHNACSSCHDANGSLASLAAGKTFATGGNCTTCHAVAWDTIHVAHSHTVQVGSGDLSYDPPGTLCSSCHNVANWSEIEGIVHNVATNGVGSCATCHNSPRQEVIDAIALGANPTNCLHCHSDKQLTVHGSVDHVAFGFVTGGATSCMLCHDPGTAANATVAVTHSSNCTLCHTTVPNLQPGIPAGGGDCATCHTSTWEATHAANPPDHSSLVQVATTSCAGCHDNTLVSAAANTHNGCSSCHITDGSLRSLAVGKDFTTGGDCTSCHTDTWATTHSSTTPDHTAVVTVTGTGCGSCHSDPPPLTDAADPKVHNACTSCHDATGGLISLAVGKTFAAGGNCATCHTGSWSATHTTAPDHSGIITVNGTGCADCHSDPPPLTDAADPKVHDACTSCHNATTGALISLATGKSAPGDCTTCHTGTWESTHVTAPSHNSLVNVSTTDCADCHSDPPPLTDAADPKVHNACATCHNATSGALVGLAVGKTFAAGGDCATCHGANVQTVHTSCTTCHGEPPNGSSSPNTTGAHDAHDVLGFGSVSPSCNACHNGASHYNGSTEVGILSNFDDMSSGSPSFSGYTCSNLSCHGGKTTPSWASGSINVNTQCTSCHKAVDQPSNRTEYNDAYTGRHKLHVLERRYDCTRCHSTTKLATGHFSNLQTTTFEQDPGTTIGGSGTSVGSYDNSNNRCSSVSCHGSENW